MYRRQQLQKLQELRGPNLAAPTTVTAGPTQITGNTRTFITSCANKVKHEPQQVHNYKTYKNPLCPPHPSSMYLQKYSLSSSQTYMACKAYNLVYSSDSHTSVMTSYPPK